MNGALAEECMARLQVWTHRELVAFVISVRTDSACGSARIDFTLARGCKLPLGDSTAWRAGCMVPLSDSAAWGPR